jgi:hypothetical protein
MPAKTETFLRTTPIDIPAAHANRAEAQQAGAIYLSQSSTDILGLTFAFIESHNLDSARVVPPVPLHISRLVVGYAQPENSRFLGTRISRHGD